MKIDEHTLAVLSRSHTEGTMLSLPDQLDRKDYLAVDKALQACGGKWNRAAKAHVFEGDAADAVEQMILTGQVTTDRDLSFFRTMGAALDEVISLAHLGSGMAVLEPSAGRGDIVLACLAEGVLSVTAVEIDERRVQGIHQIDALDGQSLIIIHDDFLAIPVPDDPRRLFERIVMNPPFTVPGDRRADLTHVTQALRWLKPGGRLVAVMGAGITFREDRRTQEFRDRLSVFRSSGVHELPPGSFSEAGTEVNTVILTVDR